MTTTAQEIADALHMDRSDIAVLIDALTDERVDHEDVPDWMTTAVHRMLDPHGVGAAMTLPA